ncbi:MAG TPA: thioredoxin domain-containing protein [Terriglobales bacterium]|nr:thioredoxin domain-containing protein [Terriglobales bacterium]
MHLFTKMTLLMVVAAASSLAIAQEQNVLRPPKGAKVAIVVFEDLQCPDCANAAPLLEEAAKTYKIPLVRHDFPLPMHNWSKDAAIMARYFDTKSKKIGNEFRDYCFRHQAGYGKEQPTITSPAELRTQAEQFASAHGIALPLAIDPQRRLQAEVENDRSLGMSIGLEHTPTIYVVSNSTQGQPFVEVVDRNNLYSQIDQMIAQAGGTGTENTSAKSRKPKKASPTT